MLEERTSYDLVNLDESLIDAILECLIKQDKLNSAFQVYQQAYDVDWNTAYNAIVDLKKFYVK